MKCPLTPDCSGAGAVPATQRSSSDPALFSAPDPTHYREYIYYHMTTPYQPSQEAQDFGRSAPDPLSNLKAGSGNETREIIEQDCDLLASESEEASALEVTEFQHKQLRVRRVLYIYSE